MKRRLYFCMSLAVITIASIIAMRLSCRSVQNQESQFSGVVCAATPEAAAAGAEILEASGNAVDAAVAVSFALAVTEPAMSGLGGQTQILIHAPNREPLAINGTSFSPQATPERATAEDIASHRATTIPSTVRTLAYAMKKYGSGKISWPQALAPAIRYADEGFVAGRFRARVWASHMEDLRQHPVTKDLFLKKDGSSPTEGELWQQPILAKTLHRLAEYGADDFYTGEIAREIAADMAGNGGWITLEDLQNVPPPVELPALKGSYRDWSIFTLPPPGSGWGVLQILNLLERSPVDDLLPASPQRLFRLAQAIQIGQTSRRNNPIKNLLDYHDEAADRVSKDTAKLLLEREISAVSGETTHFSVVDAEGMAVSVTASVNAYFGARVTSPNLGFLYNNYMNEFEIGKPEHPFALRPNAMPYSSMSPTILSQNGKANLVLGSPGSSRIISAVAQVVQLWVDAGIGIENAVAAKRIHVVPDDKLYIEAPNLADSMLAAFTQRGYQITEPRMDLVNGDLNPYFGGVHAIAREKGKWVGAADPRRDGAVKYARVMTK
ncbi:gamma-glutamyltransferase family protein [candidate division KSB1 bacterium]|nr:gamma-glutamyltransferase family protein [candidate division KSB1 bacterium]